MQKIYLLLRNNKQSGPFTREELLQQGLKKHDLIWVEGRSAGWRDPEEIAELTPDAAPKSAVADDQPPAKPAAPVPANRSRHIYILLCALINLGLGIYVVLSKQVWRKILQISGSGFILTASILFVTAFFLETRQLDWKSNFARYGIYIVTAGVIFHFIANLGKENSFEK